MYFLTARPTERCLLTLLYERSVFAETDDVRDVCQGCYILRDTERPLELNKSQAARALAG